MAYKFTAKKFALVTSAMVEAGNEADKALNAKAFNNWSQCVAAGIMAKAITLETVKESLIAQHKGAETISDCGNTVKGRFARLKRCVAGGDAFMQRLADGEALVTVAAETAPIQKQTAGKKANRGGGKGKKASKGITLEQALTALNGWLDSALGDIDLAKSLAANADMALVLAKVGKLEAVIKAGKVAKPRKKAA
jgi:hypothetical protein